MKKLIVILMAGTSLVACGETNLAGENISIPDVDEPLVQPQPSEADLTEITLLGKTYKNVCKGTPDPIFGWGGGQKTIQFWEKDGKEYAQPPIYTDIAQTATFKVTKEGNDLFVTLVVDDSGFAEDPTYKYRILNGGKTLEGEEGPECLYHLEP